MFHLDIKAGLGIMSKWYPGKFLKQFLGSPTPQKLRWVKDDANIYWTATRDYFHSLHYDEEDKVYVWYIYDWEEVKKSPLFPPIYFYDVIETTDLEEAKKYVEENMFGELIPAYPERIDELVKLRNMQYKMLKKMAEAHRERVFD